MHGKSRQVNAIDLVVTKEMDQAWIIAEATKINLKNLKT